MRTGPRPELLRRFPQQPRRILERAVIASRRWSQRREVAGEQDEDAVADVVDGRRALLPLALHLVVEDGAPGAEQGDLALERGLGREAGRVQGLQVGHVLPARLAMRRSIAARVREPRCSSWSWMPSDVARTGLSAMTASKRARTSAS